MAEPFELLQRALTDRYAVERELGQGGMATVYLAEDLKHHRKVAVKVLRPEIAATVGAGRFAREIEVAARLQHPNILPLLDSGGTEGTEGTGGFLWYVMPYVDGESLRDRLARGGELPIPDAVRILMEVADALSHAHAHGVVHRDIKPDNVMLSGRHALVADFGVAKAVTAATGYQLLTSAGVALGTPTYMAPEQATADPHQDHRVDIYALGVLGYELLTGRAPFSATTAQEMLAAHVTAVPDPVEKYRSAVSPALAAVVMKCLEKKPADRWQTAEEVLQHLEPLATPSGGTTPTQTAPLPAVRRRAVWVGIVGAAVVVILVGYGLLSRRGEPVPVLGPSTRLSGETRLSLDPAISPDGKWVAYTDTTLWYGRLMVRPIKGGHAVRVLDDSAERAWFPSWSPDGQRLLFVAYRPDAEERVAVVPAFGGPMRVLGRADGGAAAWSPDGREVLYTHMDTVIRKALDGSRSDTLSRLFAGVPGGAFAVYTCSWGSGGHIACSAGNYAFRLSDSRWLGNLAPSTIWIVPRGSRPAVALDTTNALNESPVWSGDGRHLYFVSDRTGQRDIWRYRIGRDGRPAGPAVRLTTGANAMSVSVTPDERVIGWSAYAAEVSSIWSAPLREGGVIVRQGGTRITQGLHHIDGPNLSADGRWIDFGADVHGNYDLFRVPAGGGEIEALTETPEDESSSSTAPGGKDLAIALRRDGSRDLFVRSLTGGGTTRLTNTRAHEERSPAWSPDGMAVSALDDTLAEYVTWVIERGGTGGWNAPRLVVEDRYCPWLRPGRLLCGWADRGLVLGVSTRGEPAETLFVARSGEPRFNSTRWNGWAGDDGHSALFTDSTGVIWRVAAGTRPQRVARIADPALRSRRVFAIRGGRIYYTLVEQPASAEIWTATLETRK
jgi:Tol biopolymer transport system component